MFLRHAVWVSSATVLNAAIWRLNQPCTQRISHMQKPMLRTQRGDVICIVREGKAIRSIPMTIMQPIRPAQSIRQQVAEYAAYYTPQVPAVRPLADMPAQTAAAAALEQMFGYWRG